MMLSQRRPSPIRSAPDPDQPWWQWLAMLSPKPVREHAIPPVREIRR